MRTYDWAPLLDDVRDRALEFLEGLPDRHVAPTASLEELRELLGGALPDGPTDPRKVIDQLAGVAERGLMATPSGRFFGFVIGGAVPASVAADQLASAWDQNTGLYAAAPAACVAEEIAAAWLLELLGLPENASVGFVTGTQMANMTALAAARNKLLEEAGWEVESRGLNGSPNVTVLAGDRHVTIDRALRYLGLGTSSARTVETDDQGRMKLEALAEALEQVEGPKIVCCQVGNVNSGSIEPPGEICDLAHDRGAWVHVDGAFGLWAAASPRLRSLLPGVERADSWATDAHKWLNVPYDSGVVICAHPDAHRKAMSVHASYLVHAEGAERDPMDWNPEFSRRARGFAVWAALRSLGRDGVAEIVERCCEMAQRFADKLSRADGVEVLNEVVLNQVLVRFRDEPTTKRVIEEAQRDGTAWFGGTSWRGGYAMRISVSNWATEADDVDRSIEVLLRAFRDTRAE